MLNAEDILKQKIAEQGTMAAFARKCGIPRSSLYNWLKDFDTMPAGALRIVSKALSVNPNELLMVDWASDVHIEVCNEREAELLYKYRNDTVVREFIDKVSR